MLWKIVLMDLMIATSVYESLVDLVYQTTLEILEFLTRKMVKANFTINKLPNLNVGEGKSVMMTIRSHDQYNTTIYGLSDRYRGLKGNRRIVLMNALEMAERGLKSRDSVNIYKPLW